MKKRNVLKRNSGFIVVSIIAAGVSFFGADPVLNRLYQSVSQEQQESEETPAQTQTGETSADVSETYETNPFTITASGAVLNQVESESETEADQETETTEPETGENGETSSAGETSIDGEMSAADHSGGYSEDGTAGTTDGTSPGTTQDTVWSGGDTSQDTSGSSGDTSQDSVWSSGNTSQDNSWSGGDTSQNTGGSGGDSGQNDSWSGSSGGVEIIDPGDSTYQDGTWNGDTGGSGTDSSGTDNSGTGDSGSGSYENGIYSPDDLILWHINSRYISEEELYDYDAATIRLIRNEIFALHGRIFRSEDLQAYFGSKDWYVPTYDPDEFDANMESFLNDYELANLNVILAYEEALNS